MVHLFAQMNMAAPVPAEDQKRDVAIWLVRTKVLRQKILHNLLQGVRTMDEIFWFGAPSADQNRSIPSADTRFRDLVLRRAADVIRALEGLKADLVDKIGALNGMPPLPATSSTEPMPPDMVSALDSVKAAAAASTERLWMFFTVDWDVAVRQAV